jgi:hypothetical protein
MIVEEQITSADFADARYVKIYISPERGTQVLDVMFRNGLRIHFDIPFGQPSSAIHKTMHALVQEYRPFLMKDINFAKSISFISDCVSDVLAFNGVLVPYDVGTKVMTTRWEQKILFERLKEYVPRWIEYEWAVTALQQIYALPKPVEVLP